MNPSELNYYAMMGAKTSMNSQEIRKRQKNYNIIDENYLKVKIDLESLNISNYLTLFVISAGVNPNYEDCIESLKNQTIACKIEIIKDYAPMSKAFQEMLNRCKTKYFIQVDEDMILKPNAVEIMYSAIIRTTSEVSMISHMLHDTHLDFNIYGVKIYKFDIFKNYPFNLNVISCEKEQIERIKNDGYVIRTIETVIGEHSPKWTNELIFERYFDLMEKFKIYKYEWLRNIPNKLENIYKMNPSELNYYAMMGAKTSMNSPSIRNREKDFNIINEDFLKIKKEKENGKL